jgi:hypothetical protein
MNLPRLTVWFAIVWTLTAAAGIARAQFEADLEGLGEPESESSDESEAVDTEPEPDAGSDEALRARVTLGVAGGATLRVIEMMSDDGLYKLDTGWIPAIAVALRSSFDSGQARFEGALHYETSLGAIGSQHSPDPTSQSLTTPIRTHRFEGGVLAGVRFGEVDRSVVGSVFLGYGLRALASVAELQVPRFTLHGPVFRLELEIPIVARTLRLRLAPEANAIVSISRAVRRIAETESTGFALGGEASLRLALLEWLDLQLDYRESHAFVRSERADPFRDIERFLLLAAQLQF